jgi:hypothetical protein
MQRNVTSLNKRSVNTVGLKPDIVAVSNVRDDSTAAVVDSAICAKEIAATHLNRSTVSSESDDSTAVVVDSAICAKEIAAAHLNRSTVSSVNDDSTAAVVDSAICAIQAISACERSGHQG